MIVLKRKEKYRKKGRLEEKEILARGTRRGERETHTQNGKETDVGRLHRDTYYPN